MPSAIKTHWLSYNNLPLCGAKQYNPNIAASKDVVTCSSCLHILFPEKKLVDRAYTPSHNFNNANKSKKCKTPTCRGIASPGYDECFRCSGAFYKPKEEGGI